MIIESEHEILAAMKLGLLVWIYTAGEKAHLKLANSVEIEMPLKVNCQHRDCLNEVMDSQNISINWSEF